MAPSDDPFLLGLPTISGSDPAASPVRTAEAFRPPTDGLAPAPLPPEPSPEPSPALHLVPATQPSALRVRNVGSPPESIWEDDAILENVLRDLSFEVEDAVYPGVKRVIAVLEDALLNRRFDLAPFPAAAARLLGRDGPPLSDDEIIDVIKTDPALAGNVVKTANSPFYMAAMPVNSVPRAIGRIGLQETRRICLATAVSSSFEIDGFEDVMAGMRTHAQATAMFAELLSAYVGQDPGEAFLAGLLHDAGEVATYRLISVGMKDSEKKGEVWRPDRSLLWHLAEHYHPRVGVVFFRTWDLAATVTGAMAYHHHPNWAEEGHRRLALLVHVADLLAERALEHGQGAQWQACVAVRGPVATDGEKHLASLGDGVESIRVDDLLEHLPPSFNERRLPGLVRSVLLRLDPQDLKPQDAGSWS